MIWIIVWVVLMIFWLFGGCYLSWEPNRPAILGTTIIPWLCVFILGLVVFGAISAEPGRQLLR